MKAQMMRRLRQWHLYLGVFFAPAIILFAISGGLQTYRLQEEKGYGGTPPSWIVWLASVHKDQRLPRAESKKPIDMGTPAAIRPKPKSPPAMGSKILKIFVALLAAGLTFSALLGVMIALNNRSTRTVSVMMLLLGTAIPVCVLYL